MMTTRENWKKYEKTYFMPPTPCYDWVKKDCVDKAPIWCSVDPVSYTHLARRKVYLSRCKRKGYEEN